MQHGVDVTKNFFGRIMVAIESINEFPEFRSEVFLLYPLTTESPEGQYLVRFPATIGDYAIVCRFTRQPGLDPTRFEVESVPNCSQGEFFNGLRDRFSAGRRQQRRRDLRPLRHRRDRLHHPRRPRWLHRYSADRYRPYREILWRRREHPAHGPFARRQRPCDRSDRRPQSLRSPHHLDEQAM